MTNDLFQCDMYPRYPILLPWCTQYTYYNVLSENWSTFTLSHSTILWRIIGEYLLHNASNCNRSHGQNIALLPCRVISSVSDSFHQQTDSGSLKNPFGVLLSEMAIVTLPIVTFVTLTCEFSSNELRYFLSRANFPSFMVFVGVVILEGDGGFESGVVVARGVSQPI